jgi:hypothetical protein
MEYPAAVKAGNEPPLPGSALTSSDWHWPRSNELFRRAGSDRHQRHGQARRSSEITPKTLNSGPFIKHVHGLDSFGAIRLRGKVE